MPADPSPFESAQAVQDLRARVLAKEPISPEEYRAVIESLRRTRTAAAAPAGPRKKATPSANTGGPPSPLFDLNDDGND